VSCALSERPAGAPPHPRTVDVNGFPCRVWQKGNGPKLGFIAGLGGLPRWIPFLDRLAERRTVIAPSLPGYPGALGHSVLDNQLDWVLAVRRLLAAAGLDGADLAGSSVGASFAAEMAAIWPGTVRRLALIAPFGMFDADDPPTDPWAQRGDGIAALMCADPAVWTQLKEAPPGTNSPDWTIEQTRASEAAARAFWPLGNTGLEKRLPLITAPTLLLWGEQDRIMPASYARRFAGLIKAPAKIAVIGGAGHLAELAQPDAVAAAILEWME
jgi:abhydrolase domain-containing protein 6